MDASRNPGGRAEADRSRNRTCGKPATAPPWSPDASDHPDRNFPPNAHHAHEGRNRLPIQEKHPNMSARRRLTSRSGSSIFRPLPGLRPAPSPTATVFAMRLIQAPLRALHCAPLPHPTALPRTLAASPLRRTLEGWTAAHPLECAALLAVGVAGASLPPVPGSDLGHVPGRRDRACSRRHRFAHSPHHRITRTPQCISFLPPGGCAA